jgi:GNAT superfamily N-acetyltransferase
MHVRAASEQDAEAACSVIRRSISALCTIDHQGDRDTLDQWLANKTAANMRRWIQKHHVLVAAQGSAILGVAAMTSAGEIILNYVSPDARFRGVSKSLVRGLEVRAKNLGIALLSLKSTATAICFYRSAGYTESGPPMQGFGLTMGQPMHKHLLK